MRASSAFVVSAVAVTLMIAVRDSTAADTSKDPTAIRPFTVPTVSQQSLDDLKKRCANTRWPEKETVNDQS